MKDKHSLQKETEKQATGFGGDTHSQLSESVHEPDAPTQIAVDPFEGMTAAFTGK